MKLIKEIEDECKALQKQRTELEENEIAQVCSGYYNVVLPGVISVFHCVLLILRLNLEISECNEAKEREMPLVQEVEEKVKKLQQTNVALKKTQMSLEASLKKSKDKNVEMDGKISSAEFTLLQTVQQNVILRSKIVQSPDKVARALDEKKLAREEARNAERLAMQTFHENTSLDEVYSKVNSAKSIDKDLKALKAKLSDEEVLEKLLEVKLVDRRSKVQQMEELGKQLEKDCSTRWEEVTKYRNSKKTEVESKRYAKEMRWIP